MMRRSSTHDYGRGGSLVIASNRLPVQSDGHGGQRPADGGLVRALEPLADRIDTWTGTWSANDPPPEWPTQSRVRLHPVRLRPDLAEQFYNGYANRTLWPWLHDDRWRTEREGSWWSAYQQVNLRFSHALARRSPRRATVWVHDYHLMLVPRTLRQLRPDLRIGFFLHTPFPVESSALPANELQALVHGLLGADLIGFQTEADVARFRQLADRSAGNPQTDARRGDAGPSLVACPASIDSDRFELLAADPRIRARAAALRAELGDRRIVLGVDRLDYTKAIPTRLAGYEQLLSVGLVDSAHTAFVQVVVPTRSELAAYRDEQVKVEHIARRINAQFGPTSTGSDRVALRLHTGALPVEELVAHYLAADVLVACPRRDGMNLVVKEYCATHNDGKGVLVLSTGAGAARELDGAITVSDVTPDSVALAVHHGLHLPPDEAARRMRRMHLHVSDNDGRRWAERLLNEMRPPQRYGEAGPSPSPAPIVIAWGRSGAHRRNRHRLRLDRPELTVVSVRPLACGQGLTEASGERTALATAKIAPSPRATVSCSLLPGVTIRSTSEDRREREACIVETSKPSRAVVGAAPPGRGSLPRASAPGAATRRGHLPPPPGRGVEIAWFHQMAGGAFT